MNSSHSYYIKDTFETIETQEEFENYIESLSLVNNFTFQLLNINC